MPSLFDFLTMLSIFIMLLFLLISRFNINYPLVQNLQQRKLPSLELRVSCCLRNNLQPNELQQSKVSFIDNLTIIFTLFPLISAPWGLLNFKTVRCGAY